MVVMVVWQYMNALPPYIRAVNKIEIPEHLTEFTDRSIELLEAAHGGSVELNGTSMRTEFTNHTFCSYFERSHLDNPRDFEFIAVHLGQSSLMVCLEHRHESGEQYEGATSRAFQRSTVAIQNGGAKIFHSRVVTGIGPEEDITDNKEAGLEMTSRLNHAMATLGIQEVRGAQYELRAS